MKLNKINWKLNFTHPASANTLDFFKVFNEWIAEGPEVFPEIFIDVVDYKHVKDGPWTLLVGHYVDYALDNCDEQLGFNYLRKRLSGEKSDDKNILKSSLEEFLKNCARLQNHPLIQGKLEFDLKQIKFCVSDRAIAANNEASYARLEAQVQEVITEVTHCKVQTSQRETNPNKRLALYLGLDQSISL